MEEVDLVSSLKLLLGTLKVRGALINIGFYVATGEDQYLDLARTQIEEADSCGADTGPAKISLARYQL